MSNKLIKMWMCGVILSKFYPAYHHELDSIWRPCYPNSAFIINRINIIKFKQHNIYTTIITHECTTFDHNYCRFKINYIDITKQTHTLTHTPDDLNQFIYYLHCSYIRIPDFLVQTVVDTRHLFVWSLARVRLLYSITYTTIASE